MSIISMLKAPQIAPGRPFSFRYHKLFLCFGLSEVIISGNGENKQMGWSGRAYRNGSAPEILKGIILSSLLTPSDNVSDKR